MSDFSDPLDAVAALTKAALILESRDYKSRKVRFPNLGNSEVLAAVIAINIGQGCRVEQLGNLVYYIADILENRDNWE